MGAGGGDLSLDRVSVRGGSQLDRDFELLKPPGCK